MRLKVGNVVSLRYSPTVYPLKGLVVKRLWWFGWHLQVARNLGVSEYPLKF